MSPDKDCLENLRFYPTTAGQEILDRAGSINGGKADLLYTYIGVEPVAFNRGFYTVDMRFFYRVTLNAYCSSPRPLEVEGLCVFDKRVILFGSEGNAKIFSSRSRLSGLDRQILDQSNRPVAVVEAVDPIVLDARMVERCNSRCSDCDLYEIPDCIRQCFGSELTMNGSDLTMGGSNYQVMVTLGQFSIVRLERDSQLLMPVLDYCVPEKECSGAGSSEDPCELFNSISFPVNEFFPPNTIENPRDYEGTKACCSCGR